MKTGFIIVFRVSVLLSGLFLLSHENCHSQITAPGNNAGKSISENQIDSLKNVLLLQKEDTNRVITLNKISKAYRGTGDFKNEFDFAMGALNLADKLNYKNGKAYAYLNLGWLFFDQDDGARALENYFASLKLYEETSNDKLRGYLLQMIGGVFHNQDNDADALKYLFASLKIKFETDDKPGIGQTYNSIGDIYFVQGKLDDALKYENDALQIYKELGVNAPNYGIGWSYLNIGNIYQAKGELTRARNMYLSSLKEYEDNHHTIGVGDACRLLGEINIKTLNFKEADAYLIRSVNVFSFLGNKRGLRDSYKLLSQSERARGNYKDALQYYELSVLFNDSLLNQENTKKLITAKLQYEFDKKESEANAMREKKDALTNAEIKREIIVRNLSVGGIIGLLTLGGYLYYNLNKRKKLEANQAISNERLRISRELHDDIGSTLGSIAVYSDVARNRSLKNEDPDEVLSKIGNASRELIEKMSDIVWSLNPDNESFGQLHSRMEAFASMILTPRNILVEFTTDDELMNVKLSSEQRKNIFLIFKEALHNIIKYADCRNVLISLSKSNNRLNLLIKDNGIGFEVDKITSYNGNGLENMKARAAEMKAGISINSDKTEGTKVELSLTL